MTVENGVRITWPFSNVFHASALSATLRDRALEQLREAGIEASHATERDELVGMITGQPTGYAHCTEVFVVADSDGPRARQIPQHTLDPRVPGST